MLPDGSTTKISSIFSKSADPPFIFYSEDSLKGELRLPQIFQSTEIERLMNVYVYEKNSIPAFFAAVTLMLFENQ